MLLRTMSLLGTLIHQGARLGDMADKPRSGPASLQSQQLRLLLRYARHTAFGRYYKFYRLLNSPDSARAFSEQVPATDYNAIYDKWWQRARLSDEPDVCWPGQIPYFALSSGTSQAATKYIPITMEQLRAIRRGTRRLFFALSRYELPNQLFSRQMLMVGSCTTARRIGNHFEGDVSGIMGHHRPLWMQRYYRPGRQITDLPEWGERIERISEEAPRWNIGFAVGNPMWTQMILERIIERYSLRHIHEIWPDFTVFAYGGVFFEPYRPSFEQLLGKQVHYINTYLASEGFFAYQNQPASPNLTLIADGGIFFEFVPFDSRYFDENGDLTTEFPEVYTLDNAVPNQQYAMLLTTCAGAWRYLLGDTITFTNVSRGEFRLTGRTKQFLSVCGEHVSIDNLNEAVRRADDRLNAGIREFAVAGVRDGSFWRHQWYIAAEKTDISPETLATVLDEELIRLNDDYAVERQYALRKVDVRLVTNEAFMKWLSIRGKFNGQAKIPRVFNSSHMQEFEDLLVQAK